MSIPAHLEKPVHAKGLADIKALLLDVDGVLTTGEIIYGAPVSDDGSPQGTAFEIKAFSVKDGLGLRMALDAGVKVAVVTGRASAALNARLDNLGLDPRLRFDGVKDKAAVVSRLEEVLETGRKSMAFLADDLPDLPLLALVGAPLAVADAHPEVISRALMVTRNPGGRGAVREVCEALVRARGQWDTVMRRYGL
ncbi:MAG: phenylphosphate carboxylase subunit delta [Thermodesulfobacteriota bacterium]